MTALRPLGELEAVVMNLIWDSSEPLTVRAVLERMDREPPLAYTTVLTVADNLHRKGYLTRERVGRAFAYTPVKPRAEYTADLMDELLSGSGDRPTTLLRFVDRMTPDEVSALKRVLGG